MGEDISIRHYREVDESYREERSTMKGGRKVANARVTAGKVAGLSSTTQAITIVLE